MRSKFRIPEVALGALLATALISIVLVLGSSQTSRDIEDCKPATEYGKEVGKGEKCETMWQRTVSDPVAFLTLLLVVIGAFQALFFYVQLRLIRKSLVPAEAAAIAAKDAADTAKASADHAREAFIKLERPYVYIFGVHKFETDMSDPVSDTPHVKYSVANYGKTPATIKIIAPGIGSHPDQPLDPLIVDYRDHPAHDLLTRPIVAPADVRTDIRVHAPGNLPFVTVDGEVVPQLTECDQMFVWIQIEYRGPFGEQYQTSACWRYDGLTNRLVLWGGDQYNYGR